MCGSSFIYQLAFTSEDDHEAVFKFRVPIDYSDTDDDINADSIAVCPEVIDGKAFFGGRSPSSARDIQELAKLILNSAKIRKLPFKQKFTLKGDPCTGITFAIAGDLIYYESREALASRIESNGGFITDIVTENTKYLICPDPKADLPEIKTAIELGVAVMGEAEFIYTFDKERYDEGITITPWNIGHSNRRRFFEQCKQEGINIDNLKRITVRNMQDGYSLGGAAKIDYEHFLNAFEADCILLHNDIEVTPQRLLDFVKTKPVLPVELLNNEDLVEMVCVWNGTDEYFKSAIKEMFEVDYHVVYFSGTYSSEIYIDAKTNAVSTGSVAYPDRIGVLTAKQQVLSEQKISRCKYDS